MMNRNLLDIVVCPICKSSLHLDEDKHELICKVDKLAYPIRDDIPVMLVDEARSPVPRKRVRSLNNLSR